MEDMTQEEFIEFQERLSKLPAGAPETLAYNDKQRLNLIANLIADKIIEDRKNGEPLLRKIKKLEKENKAKEKKVKPRKANN